MFKWLLTLDDSETRLPVIVRLEGFQFDGPCLYRYVLVLVRTNGVELPVWLYVGDDPISGRLTPLGGFRWPR